MPQPLLLRPRQVRRAVWGFRGSNPTGDTWGRIRKLRRRGPEAAPLPDRVAEPQPLPAEGPPALHDELQLLDGLV